MMKLWRALSISLTRLSDLEFSRPRQNGALAARAVAFVAVLVCAAVFPHTAGAGWPERTVKLIVTFPPGSANDAAARIFADGLSKTWGKPVVVEDKTGAEGTIGVGSFVSAQDDHTLLYTVAGSV